MKICASNRINLFMNALSAKSPSPGGGAVAALVGALGVALIIKVANFTIGNKKYRRHTGEAKAIAKKAGLLERRLRNLIERDARAYSEYSKMKSRAAMRNATLCVAEISNLSRRGLKFCTRLEKIGNVNLKGDLYAAKAFLGSSAKAADNLARLNKKWMGR